MHLFPFCIACVITPGVEGECDLYSQCRPVFIYMIQREASPYTGTPCTHFRPPTPLLYPGRNTVPAAGPVPGTAIARGKSAVAPGVLGDGAGGAAAADARRFVTWDALKHAESMLSKAQSQSK